MQLKEHPYREKLDVRLIGRLMGPRSSPNQQSTVLFENGFRRNLSEKNLQKYIPEYLAFQFHSQQ